MLSTCKIDWLTGVVKYAKQHPFPSREGEYTFVPCSGWAGYDVGQRELDTGVKRYSSSSREDMGMAVVLSATALGELARCHASHDMLKALWDTGFREYSATRLDLAIDLYDGGLNAHRVARAARRDVINTKARQISVIEQERGGDGITTYIGSRGSTRFIRVYDKNAESGGRVPVSRFELQANKGFANELWKSMRTHSQSDLNTVAFAAVNGLVSSWGDEQVDREMQFVLSCKPSPKPEPSEDAWNWISKQVLPTLTRDFYLKEEEQETLLYRLIQAIKRGDVE